MKKKINYIKNLKKRILYVSIISILLLITLILKNLFSDKYGISKLCSWIGGIWCYYPSWKFIFNLIIFVLIILLIILVMFIVIRKNEK
ncbi:MAG: hypothetical protein QXW97_01055 [Candidatus Pacearchaeota archaeon]